MQQNQESSFIQKLSEEELNCPNCGSMMKKVREEKSYRVVQIPTTEPLRTLYYRELNRGKYLQFNETPIEIQKQNKKAIVAEYWDDSRYRKKKDDDGESEAKKNCYMWVVIGGEHKIRTYNFRWTRSGKNSSPIHFAEKKLDVLRKRERYGKQLLDSYNARNRKDS